MLFRRRALFLAGLFAAVSCSDAGNIAGPEGPRPQPPSPDDAVQALVCTVSVNAEQMRCDLPTPGTGAGRGTVIGGSNGYNVLLTSSNFSNQNDTLEFDVTIRNNMVGQTLGVDTEGNVAPDGIRVFFYPDPSVTAGPGPVTNFEILSDGSTLFMGGGNSDYFQYAPAALPTNATTPARRWRFHTQNVASFSFFVYVNTKVKFPDGWTTISPDSPLVEVGGKDTLMAHIRSVNGRQKDEDLAVRPVWTSSNPGVVTVDTLDSDTVAEITGVGEGTAWVKVVSGPGAVRKDSVLVTVNNSPLVTTDSIDGLSNVTDSIAAPRLDDNVEAGASIIPGTYATAEGGTATVYADGGFTYLSAPGFAGKDTISYPVNDGLWTVQGKVIVDVKPSNYWYVQQGASGDGRDRSPFGTLAAALAAAGTADSILVLNGAADLPAGVTLANQQALIGQGIPADITTTLNGHTLTILAAGSAPGLTRADAGAAVTLGQDNVIRGLGITAAAGAAISGSNFGTLFVRNVGVNPAGPALDLNTGTADAIFDVLSSTNSATTGLSLASVDGSITGTGGAISGAAGTAVNISGGGGTIDLGGSVSNAAGLAVRVAGRTGGAVTLSGNVTDSGSGIEVTGTSGGTITFGGALSLTGSGVNVHDNSGGTVAFGGAADVINTGANAGVTLATNPNTTVEFNGGVAVTTTSGAGFSATGAGTVTVEGAGNTVSTGTGTALTLTGVNTGTDGLTFASVSSSGAPSGIALNTVTGRGVSVQGGTIANPTSHGISINTLGTTELNLSSVTVSGAGTGGSAGFFANDADSVIVSGVSITAAGGPALVHSNGRLYGAFTALNSSSSASNGVVLTAMGGDFDAGGSITGAAATAFAVTSGGDVDVDFTGGINQSSATPLLAVNGGHTGTLAFGTGVLQASAGTGLQFDDADGTYNFTGTTTLAGGDAGIDVIGGSGGSFGFGAGVSISNPTGPALFVDASAPGLSFSGSIATGSGFGRPVHIEDVTGGAINVGGTLNSAGQGILVQNGTGGSTTFSGAKTLNTTTNNAVTLISNGAHGVSFTNGSLASTTSTGAGISATGSGTVAVSGADNNISTGSGAALNLSSVTVGGMTLGNVNVTGATNGISLVNVTHGGAITTTGGTITGTAGGAPILVSGGSVSMTLGGSVTQALNNALLSVAGGHSGALTFQSGTLTGSNGTGLLFDNADGTYTFTGTTNLSNSVAGGTAGIDVLNGSNGTFTWASTTSITNPTATQAVFIDASAPTFTYGGTISTNGTGRPVQVEDLTGGSVSFTGAVSSTGLGILVQNNTSGTPTVGFSGAVTMNTAANAAVTLDNNDAATVNFTSGSLGITATSGRGFHAANGGTVNVTGSANTVATTSGTAVEINGTTIGASGVTFRSVSATSGAPNGIMLSGTGTTGGGFNVTGTGAAGTGGTIASTSGTDGNVGGNAVYLSSVQNVRLARMQINDNPNHGIFGTGVTNFTLDSAVVNGTNGSSIDGTFNEGAIHLETLAGQVMIRQNTISGGFLDNVYVANNSGAPVLNRMQLINNTIGGVINQDGVRLTATVGTFNVTATGNSFTYWEGDAFDMLAQGTATGDLVFQNNTAHNTNATPVSGSTNIAVGGGNYTYNISNNSFRGAAGAAIAVDESGSIVGSVSGTIHNNQIGASGVANSGSSQGSGIFVQQLGAGTTTTRISNNTIRQINGSQAILVQVSDASAGGGNGTLNATVVGNNIQEEGATAATRTSMNFNIGTVAGDAHTACLQIGGSGAEENSITNFDTNRYRVQHRFNTTVRMPGYGGTAYDVTAVGSYLTPRNDIGGQALTNNSSSSGTGGGFQNTAGSAACPQPTT